MQNFRVGFLVPIRFIRFRIADVKRVAERLNLMAQIFEQLPNCTRANFRMLQANRDVANRRFLGKAQHRGAIEGIHGPSGG